MVARSDRTIRILLSNVYSAAFPCPFLPPRVNANGKWRELQGVTRVGCLARTAERGKSSDPPGLSLHRLMPPNQPCSQHQLEAMGLLVLPETCSQRRDWITLDLVNMQAQVLFRRKVAFHYLHQNFPRIRCHIRVSSSVKPKTHEFGLCTGDYFVIRVAVSGDFDASEVHHLASIAFSLPFPEA